MLIEFSIEGQRQLVRRFRGIELSTKNWKPVMKKIGMDLTKTFSGPVFETRGREIGESWEPRIKSYPWPILEKTGRMRKGFKFNADDSSVEIYNIADYFVYHQSREPRTKLPRRVMMKLAEKQKNMIIKRFHETFIKKLQARR